MKLLQDLVTMTIMIFLITLSVTMCAALMAAVYSTVCLFIPYLDGGLQ